MPTIWLTGEATPLLIMYNNSVINYYRNRDTVSDVQPEFSSSNEIKYK